MPDYDAALFNPPAPVARVTLRNPQSSAELTDQPFLMDTGADATLVPLAALAALGLHPSDNPPNQLGTRTPKGVQRFASRKSCPCA
jgi:hypothetical protein